jgi:hypothetical protein
MVNPGEDEVGAEQFKYLFEGRRRTGATMLLVIILVYVFVLVHVYLVVYDVVRVYVYILVHV